MIPPTPEMGFEVGGVGGGKRVRARRVERRVGWGWWADSITYIHPPAISSAQRKERRTGREGGHGDKERENPQRRPRRYSATPHTSRTFSPTTPPLAPPAALYTRLLDAKASPYAHCG